MKIFDDRVAAGEALVEPLEKYRNHPDAIVIALPRGGVPVGAVVARALGLPLDITCPRKIGAPGNPEYAIGAITETGEGILDREVIEMLGVTQEYLMDAVEREKQEAAHRLKDYRKGLPERDLAGKIVILIDDGLATGATMLAAIKSIRNEGASKIVVAVPVAPPDTLRKLEDEVDEIICLYAPSYFQAVGQFYLKFGQTTDEEVIFLLRG